MSVRRFLVAYLGVVIMLGAAGAAMVQAVKQRHAETVPAMEPQPVAAAEPAMTRQPEPAVTRRPQQPQETAAVAPRPAPVNRASLPPLRPPHAASQQAKAPTGRPGSARPAALAARTTPQHSPPRKADTQQAGPPYYGPGPYAGGWPLPGTVMMPRSVQAYPYYPYNPGYYGQYQPWSYYRSF
jgi:hypothetical protein